MHRSLLAIRVHHKLREIVFSMNRPSQVALENLSPCVSLWQGGWMQEEDDRMSILLN